MSFASPAFLWALLAVAVPLLIHLLLRDRIQRVDFPTLRFFAKGARTVLRKRSIREAILLALRVILVALLVLAFARPQPGAAKTEAGAIERVRVLVLDGSGSMAGNRTWLAATARTRLGEMRSGQDAVAVITIGETVRVLVEPTTDHAKVEAALATFAPGHSGTDLVNALRKADELLATVKAREKTVVLLSDLPRNAWAAYRGDWKLAPGVELLTEVPPAVTTVGIVVSDADAPGNIALDGVARAISLRLTNPGDQPAAEVKIALHIDGKEADTRIINLPAKGTGTVRFRHVFDQAGEHPCEVLVQEGGNDANHYRFVVRVMARVPVVLVGNHALKAGNDPAFFVKLALAPDEQSPFIVQEFATRGGNPAILAGVRVAVITATGEPPEAVKKGLQGILERGGGLLFLPARCDPAEFRRAYGELAPCRLQRIITEDRANPQAVAAIDFNHPAFDIFSRPHWGDLAVPRFTSYWEVADVQGATVPLRLANGRPLLIERRSGDGISMLLASPPETNWNDLPFQAVFLPMLHQTVRHLAVRGLPPTVLTVGERLPGLPEAEVVRPDRATVRLAETSSDLPGFYTTRSPGQEAVQVAVNRPFAEADVTAVSAEQVVAALRQGGSGALSTGSGDVRGGGGSTWWWWVLAMAAVVAVAELTLGNRTQRH